MKYLITLLFLTSYLYGGTQIITNNEETKKKESTDLDVTSNNKSGTEIYFGASPSYTFRTLEINEGVFAKPIGERANETAEWETGFNAGVRTKLNQHMKFEIGAGYAANAESYNFSENDSLYKYTNTYRHISFPIRLAYTFGDEISFYGGVGVMPKAFISMKKETTTLDINNNEKTVTTNETDKFNYFLVDAVATLGTQIKFSEHYGIFAMLEGRRQLNSSYDTQSPYIRKAYALGFNFGIEIYF
ncbi:outer membrane beta-barrel protein [Brumimicrobium aurantiacum]|uniref:Outer membrane protein beta-barrel domain-containing protein n=1 Tax=Brumimicrobium aurantiacum TaxID=1737063 RepID=A0A3E1EZI8_9FLAO|nr:outer membrane beta-barrel protein [Brumimicrobium aurantiacum]RFC54980.1 hypothetical protein DXU93_03930 [Brumimicrobium aurantiacum]